MIASTLVAEYLPKQLGVQREYVTIGTAVGGLLLALNSQGAIRAAAISMAAHATAQELMKRVAIHVAPSVQPPEPVSTETESAFITRADLQSAITRMQGDQQKAIVDAVRAVMTELGPTLVAARRGNRNANGERRTPKPIEEPARFEQPISTDEAPSNAPIEIGAEPIAGPEQVERVQAVYSQLAPQERRLLSFIIAALPHSQANEVTAQLSTLPTDRAVEFARSVIPLAAARGVT